MGFKKTDISYPKYLFHKGTNMRSYEFLGVHHLPGAPVEKTVFRLWAPRAISVALVGDFNHWDPSKTPMVPLWDDPEIWEVTCPKVPNGTLYKFAITDIYGNIVYKADPYAFAGEPGTLEDGHLQASVVVDIDVPYPWDDASWLQRRKETDMLAAPLNIYEVHLGSWKRDEDGKYYSYQRLAKELIPYMKDMGYTHIELLPVTEYPYDGSWGYQTTGYFSITWRYGSPADFKDFVNAFHKAGLGVIVDWVPAHFPKDQHGLANFDGQPLYEYTDVTKREHLLWGTYSFDFGRPEVISFLTSSATFFCQEYHVDGIRVDAVAAMLYLDYNRKDGAWIPNENGGRENLEAVAFLKKLNQFLLSAFPGLMMIAEESTTWPMVTMPPADGGLGFNFKWNMGWMNDVLEYFSTDPLFRKSIHHRLTFSISYAYSENFILPISHDEVVHGKHSLLDKMPGTYQEKFSNLRAFYLYMMTHPGKKLVFMGSEWGQFIEWNEKQGLDWLLLDYPQHKKTQDYVRDINHLYQSLPALWQLDTDYDGFQWIDADNQDDNVYIYCRKDKEEQLLLCILNLSGNDYKDFHIGVPAATSYRVLLDSDAEKYGGRGVRTKENYAVYSGHQHGRDNYIRIALPALSAVMLERKGSL